MKRGILYGSECVINAGGLINVDSELKGYSSERAFNQTEGFQDTLMAIFEWSDKEGITTNLVSDHQREDRIRKMGELMMFYLST